MTYQKALRLMNFLKARCPYDTGNLKASIQTPQGNSKEWIIVIGNEDTSISGTASNKYASILNDAVAITRRTKNGIITYQNKHYKWVNNAVRAWFFAYMEQDAEIYSVEDDED
jgi:hypothetical protein